MQRGEFLLLIAAIGLILGGAGLAWRGGGLVRDLVTDATMRPSASSCSGEMYCYAQFSLPDPRPTFAAYLVAMPMGMGTGYALDWYGRRRRGAASQGGQVARLAGLATATAMAWMAVLYVWGGLSRVSIGLRDPSVLSLAYAASLLVVPSLLVSVGCVLVLQWVSDWFSGRTRVALG